MNKQKTIHDTEPTEIPRGRVKKLCACGKWFVLPACHAPRHNSCSIECAKVQAQEKLQERQRPCEVCAKDFVPRIYQLKVGQGRFCSHRCGAIWFAQTPAWREARQRCAESYKRNLAAGKFKRATGPEHHQWQGGPIAARRRATASGKAKAKNAEYRRNNPHKVREWVQKRKPGYLNRLPKGSVALIYKMQKGRCVYCRVSLTDGYHADHIIPLAAGGLHEKHNIQLLCGTCNVRKWKYHPIEYAQKIGKLL